MAKAGFTVDTQLFRELGDLLVGKDSTALAELVKNAYDADARTVAIVGANLSQPDRATITVTDDGSGMSEAQFRKGFLTIAGRSKGGNVSRSAIFQRVMTGEKGVGRLAARKLAHRLTVETRAYDGSTIRGAYLPGDDRSITATIDWDKIESCVTIDEVEEAGAVVVARSKDAGVRPRAGTTITLGPLRRPWQSIEKSRFVTEIKSLQPWPSLIERLPRRFGKLLFERLNGPNSEAPFELRLEGEFEDYDPLGPAEIESATWAVEIECDKEKGNVTYAIGPSKTYWKSKWNLDLDAECLTRPISDTKQSEYAFEFKARVLEREDEAWSTAIGGVRVFMDGFRVLPYGEKGDDWLGIDADYSNRGVGTLRGLRMLDDVFPAGDRKEELGMKRNASYLGAVLISKTDAPGLEILVTREGFVPGPQLEWLRDQVRIGIDLMTRARRGAVGDTKRARKEFASQLQESSSSDVEQAPSVQLLRDTAREARSASQKAQQAFARNDQEAASAAVEKLDQSLQLVNKVAEEMSTEQSMLRVLASVGSQLWILSHEVNGLLELANTIRHRLDQFIEADDLPRDKKRKLGELAHQLSDLHHGLERQAIYLTDVAGIEARRRRSKQALRKRFESAQRLLQFAIDRKGLIVENELPDDAKSPSMFAAEVVAIFTNLLSNSVKAAEEGGKIRIRQGRTPLRVVMENSGTAVDIDDSEKWFKPFKSTTVSADSSLGQGMGLGLTIVRSILDEYGAEIRFIRPTRQYATAIEIVFSEG